MSGIQQTLLGGSPAGYQIERSLRFNSADSAYLNRTPASAGNRKTWTWSGWVKRSFIGATNTNGTGLFGAGTLGNNANFRALFDSGAIYLQETVQNVSNQLIWTSTPVYRDPSAWYHIVIAMDTTQATASNRVKVYVNGSQITGSFSVTPSQNQDTSVNNNVAQYQGASPYNSAALWYLDGYITELNFIDGQALEPSSFGETDSATGVWKPKKFSGTYGTNGFYLNFSDNSNTTAATLGKDSSGNGNNWTPNNFSVTAGAGNDSLVDTPTSYGTDTGVGGEVRGNYCTLNPLKQAGATLTNGNLDVSIAAGPTNVALGTIGVTSGKWYWEVTLTTASNIFGMIGVADASAAVGSSSYKSANGWTYYSGGQFYTNDTSSGSPATYTTNDVIGVALDMDAGTLVFYKNGTSQGTAYNTGLSGKTITPLINTGSGTYAQTYTANFGQRPFAYTAPSGFKALCTQNLPTPTIGATSTTQAGKYMNAVIWTGTGSGTTRAITGVGFQPDFVWAKIRSQAYNNVLYDVIRGGGANSELVSNSTAAEGGSNNDQYGYLSSFDSDGFTSTAGTAGAGSNLYFNASNDTYVAWNWKANGTGVTNTAGTITSTVSANTTSGFSIISYTGNGITGATVGHGLGAAPKFIIWKPRASVTDWMVWHTGLSGYNYDVRLNTTTGQTTGADPLNNTAPSSTVITLRNQGDVNGSGTSIICYCFAAIAGYSAFGSYTGNGSTDGPFLHFGFRARWIMYKRTDSTGQWNIIDTARNPSNQLDTLLRANLSNADETNSVYAQDITSNGWKIRSTNVDVNTSGATYIYAAFCESPFKFSLAR